MLHGRRNTLMPDDIARALALRRYPVKKSAQMSHYACRRSLLPRHQCTNVSKLRTGPMLCLLVTIVLSM
jgi:hypothetical protein